MVSLVGSGQAGGFPSPLSIPSFRSAVGDSALEPYLPLRCCAAATTNVQVKVIAVTPGLLATNLGRGNEFLKSIGAFPVSAGADFVKGVVEGKWDEKAGKLVGLGHEHEGGVCPW